MKRSTLTLTLAGLLDLLAVVVSPDRGTKAAERYSGVLTHPHLQGLAALLYLLSGVTFVIAGLFAFADRPTGRGSLTTGIGSVLTAVSGIWLAISLSAYDMTILQLVQEKAPLAVAHTVVNGEATPWQHAYDLVLLCQLAGPTVLAYGLRRGGRASWLPMGLYLIGIVGYGATEFIFWPGQVAGLTVVAIGLFLIGRGIDTQITASTTADRDTSTIAA